jgi:hypothetical protein
MIKMERGKRRLFTASAPPGPPCPGRNYYLPDDYFFGAESTDVSLSHVARVTAHCVAQWADRFEAFPLGTPEQREGFVPNDPTAREALIDGLFDWLHEVTDRISLAAVSLFMGDCTLLDQHDGIPGILTLEPNEFAELQDSWERQRLPRDLYYLANDQREVVETVTKYGGVFRVVQRYSPRQWARRNHPALEEHQIPSDRQRAETFAAACQQFANAVMLRIYELTEPGGKPDKEEIKKLGTLLRDVRFAAGRAIDPKQTPDKLDAE